MTHETQRDLETLGHIDELSDRFERVQASGESPRIEEFLEQIGERFRPRLLRELLLTEWQGLTEQDQFFDVEDYVARFSNQSDLVRETYQAYIDGPPATDEFEAGRGSDGRSRVIGNYKLLQLIGQGGMGTVWMAEQERPVRRRVALKLIKDGVDSKPIIARFEAERQALAMMDHPNIARVLDAGTTDDDRPFFVMELIHGLQLTEYCDKHKLALEDRLRLFVPVCHAIQHAHHKGILHRDIKPSNVLVTTQDDKPLPKVIDFGLAKALDAKLTDKTLFTQFGQVVGSYEYMSPEQADSNTLDVDTRTDVYSLGTILYELLTGTTPLERKTLGDHGLNRVLQIIQNEDPPRPSSRLSSSANSGEISSNRNTEPARLGTLLRGDLDWIAMKALEKDRTRRYATPAALADDVERFLNEDAVEARPPSLSYRLQRTYRRNRAAVLTGMAFVLLLLTGTFVSIWQAVRASDETTRANAAERTAQEEKRKAIAAERVARVEEGKARALAAEMEKLAEREAKERRAAEDLAGKLTKEKRSAQWQQQGQEILPTRYLTVYSPHGRTLAVAERDRLILCDLELGEKWALAENFQVRALTYADTATLVGIGAAGEIRIWDVATRELLGACKHSEDVEVNGVTVSPEATSFATGGAEGWIRFWRLPHGEPDASIKAHDGPINSLAFDPNGPRIASVGADNLVKIWDRNGRELIRVIAAIPSPRYESVDQIAFLPSGQVLAGRLSTGTAMLWNSKTAENIMTFERDPDGSSDGVIKILSQGASRLQADIVGFDEIADVVKDRLGKLGVKEVEIGSFTGGADTVAGRIIRNVLEKRLTDREVNVVPFGGTVQVRGTYRLPEKPEVADGGPFLVFSIELIDRLGRELDEPMTHRVNDLHEIARLQGATFDLGWENESSLFEDANREELNKRVAEAITKSIEKPAFGYVDGTDSIITATSGSPLRVEIHLAHESVFAPASVHAVDGVPFVKYESSDRYSVRIYNESVYDIAVELSVDGLNSFAYAETDSPSGKALKDAGVWVIPAKKENHIRGWFINHADVRDFRAAGRVRITAMFFRVRREENRTARDASLELSPVLGAISVGIAAPNLSAPNMVRD
jgi:serine/threonine protein kinase